MPRFFYEAVKLKRLTAPPSYGIGVNANVENKWVQLLFIPDVSTNGDFASALAAKCTRLQLSPLHLHDVLYDTLP